MLKRIHFDDRDQLYIMNGIKISNTLRLRQNGPHFADIFKSIFLTENVGIWVNWILLSKGPVEKKLALVQVMAKHQWGDEPLPEPMTANQLMHIYITRHQWDIAAWKCLSWVTIYPICLYMFAQAQMHWTHPGLELIQTTNKHHRIGSLEMHHDNNHVHIKYIII